MRRFTKSIMRCAIEALEPRELLTAYYLSPSGNNNGPGTMTKPWQTIYKVNNTVLKPGDSIFFQGGADFSGTTLYLESNDAGTSVAPVTIGSYGTGRATLGGSGAAIYAYNTSGILIQNLNFVGSSSLSGGIF